MINTQDFGKELKIRGFTFFSGVPCSFLKPLINYAINECNYIMATNEGDAIATCAGAFLGGMRPVFLCQNSGITNASSPLTSLIYTFRIPLLGIVSLRGESGLSDEPQHELMGAITTKLLSLMGIKWEFLESNLDAIKQQLENAEKYLKENKAFFFVIRKNTFDKEDLKPQPIPQRNKKEIFIKNKKNQLPHRYDALKIISSFKNNKTALLATTGHTGRELHDVDDTQNNFYMVGSMGCISSFALGLALSKPNKRFIAIDGDGAFLMRMGAITTNGYYAPPNLMHILLDNGMHASTGGQQTVSSCVDFVSLAASSGYTQSIYVHTLNELEKTLKQWKSDKLTFLYMKIAQESKKNLGRPTIKPWEVKQRLMNFMDLHD